MFNNLKHLFKYKKKYRHHVVKRILVVGGYGFGNVGDEAQLNETIKLLSKRYNNYQIEVLSPNPNYTFKEHGCFTDYASRVSFYNQGYPDSCFKFNSLKTKLVFCINMLLIYINAFLVRADYPTVFINARKSSYLVKLKESSLLYFSGGGYLTGDTKSRLFDGIFLCLLAQIFKTPVVMSGQTIGIFKNKFEEIFARFALKHVELITTRDENYSISDLEKINLKGENIFATHDDALFCDKSDIKQVDFDNYITLNFHYWGMKENQKTVNINKINSIVSSILNKTDYKIIFIPMHKTDKMSFEDYISKYPNERITCFDYDYDFRKIRQVISNSKMCITMKHHPVIFAMGEDVPVISLAFSIYYVRKNLGALEQYGMEKYSIDLENDSYLLEFNNLFDDILLNKNNIIQIIECKKKNLIKRKNKFLTMVDAVLLGGN